jgi:hypothetical protein
LLLLIGSGFLGLHFLSEELSDFIRYGIWSIYSLFFLSAMFIILLTKRQEAISSENILHSNYRILWLMPVIVLLNGACPYLGLKTESSFAMFSNLRTEGNQTNHLFIPVSAQLFNFQKDIVEFVSSTDPKIQKMANEQKLMTFFELRRHVSSNKPFSVSYIRQGKLVEVANTATSEEFAESLPLIFRGIFYFRTIDKFQQDCSH